MLRCSGLPARFVEK